MVRDLVDDGTRRTARTGALGLSGVLLRWTSRALLATVWLSSTLFGLYILAFYAGAVTDGDLHRWNQVLPGLYARNRPVATTGIGLHFAAGGLLLVIGCVQLLGALRRRLPVLHRWLGRVYVAAALLASLGGLAFIVTTGTIGGPVMDLGFTLYGLVLLLAAVQTYRSARARQLDRHRVWALRLFALALGSWLYRMDYGFWIALADSAGHTQDFRGPFDLVMAFFFYVPNLLVVEALVRARRPVASLALQLVAAGMLVAATGVVLLGTYVFTLHYWGPAILYWLMG